MTVGIYDLVTLLDVVQVYKLPTPFWLKWFPNQINFETDKIAFDRVSKDYRRMAPFVVPNAQGTVIDYTGYDTVEFKPAYIKMKDIIDPDRVMVRRAGESLMTGSLTNAQRRDAVIADILFDHQQRKLVTLEWMAARAIIDGKVTISGPDYPTTLIDFRRDASLNYVLTGEALWSAPTTADPLGDIRTARNNVKARTGSVVRDLVFGLDAWADFIARDDVLKLMNNDYRGSQTDLNRLADAFEDNFEFAGQLKGSQGGGAINCWIYSGKYIHPETGVETNILDPDCVVGVASSVDGFRCFGAIKDKKAGFQALEYFPKMWEEEDPAVEYLMGQSAPLMVPRQPNNTFKIKVR